LSSRAKSRAAAIRAELDTLRKLDEVIESIIIARLKCPEVFNEFKKEILAAINDDISAYKLPEQSAPPEPAPASVGDEETGAEKLDAFFRARDNAPASVEEMSSGIGRSKVTVKSIVYRRHKELFERVKQRGPNNAAYFRLKQPRPT